MDDMFAAIAAGDYATAYEALLRGPDAATQIGDACAAVLLAMLERFDEALQRARAIPGFEVIVQGARQRAARWREVSTGGAFGAISQPAHAASYAAIAAAFAARDEALATRSKAELAGRTRVAGTITFVDGSTRAFTELADADDAIGPMLETYFGDGLLYFPFDAVRRIDVLPKTNFIDDLLPKVKITTARGVARAYVPLHYSGSGIDDVAAVRSGRMTLFDYLGTARRGRGQRDFVADGGALIGFERISVIELA